MCRASALAVMLMLWGMPVWGAMLEWKANSAPNIAGYHVYYCSSLPCTSGTAMLLVTLGKVSSFNIGTPAVTQYYVITAYNFRNKESGPSNVATYFPPGVSPPPPTATGSLTVPGSTTLSKWVTAWGPNRLDIFGIGADGAMYHKAWNGLAWQPAGLEWERLGGNFTSPPAITAWGPNRLDIFGIGTDGAMVYKAWTGSTWHPAGLEWEHLGGNFTSPPAVTAWSPNRLDIFGRGTNGAMVHKAWTGSAWHPAGLEWERLGGNFISPPAVTAWGPNRLDIFGIGTDGAMVHKAWDSSAWQPSGPDWDRLGGVFTAP